MLSVTPTFSNNLRKYANGIDISYYSYKFEKHAWNMQISMISMTRTARLMKWICLRTCGDLGANLSKFGSCFISVNRFKSPSFFIGNVLWIETTNFVWIRWSWSFPLFRNEKRPVEIVLWFEPCGEFSVPIFFPGILSMIGFQGNQSFSRTDKIVKDPIWQKCYLGAWGLRS